MVVRDVRHVVYAVFRRRPRPDGLFDWRSLGSGFFFSPSAFLTCNHVINGAFYPHQDGDAYVLFSILEGVISAVEIPNARLGTEVHLFADSDLCVLKLPGSQRQGCWASLDYGYVWEGREIGVAGYPIPAIRTVNNSLALDGLIFRVAKGEVTARYLGNFNSAGLSQPITNIPVIEVNFLFVPGNSGGPIFDATKGQALGFVHGYGNTRIKEEAAEANPAVLLLPGMDRKYVARLDAIYSIGIKLDRVRVELERLA